MAMHEENMVAIGRERKIIIWCIESGSCDQKLSKGKIQTFKRIRNHLVFVILHSLSVNVAFVRYCFRTHVNNVTTRTYIDI